MCREIVQISCMGNNVRLLDQNEQVVLEAFNKFIEVFIIGKKSLIIEAEDIEFTKEDIFYCLNFLETILDKKGKNKGEEQTADNVDEKENKKEDYGNKEDLIKAIATILDNDKRKKIVIILWHCYWIMYLMNNTPKKFFLNDLKITVREKYPEGESGISLFVDNEIASTDMAYSSGTNKAFIDIIKLLNSLFDSCTENDDIQSIKNQILENEGLSNNRAKNVLLYLCDPFSFPCIISQRHQDAILKAFGKLYEEEASTAGKSDAKKQVTDKFPMEAHVKKIETGVIKDFGCTNLYDDKIKSFWDFSTTNLSTDKSDELPKDTLLKYKKAIVLYGPPGTSKSFEARTMSKNLLRLEFLKNLRQEIKNNANADNKSKLEKFIDDFIDICDERTENANTTNTYNGIPHIHRLQLHPGYTYDDFIIGKTIKRQNVQMQKGYLMRLIDKIRCDRSANTQYANLPHILILDEINRVDISRVFGELFTAMEKDYRKTGVDLPVTEGRNAKSWKLQVPEDLYIIGTMNMIDFSLEQVDFALRRRFAWIESNYEEKRLKAIIEEKRLKAITDGTAASSITDKEIKEFATRCTALNAKISNETSLGPAYQIGHAFFAEIVDIYSQVKSDNKQNPWDVAQNVLWSISIRPTLDAYCGSMDNEQKKQFIGDCKDVFIPKKSTDVSTNKQGAAQSSSGNE